MPSPALERDLHRHLACEAIQVIIRLAGQAPCRYRSITSNVRAHSATGPHA